jgi:hypothetical protein
MNELLVVKWSTKSVFFNEIKFVNSESKYGIFFVGTNKGTGTLIDLI